jgi:hypothetical protein
MNTSTRKNQGIRARKSNVNSFVDNNYKSRSPKKNFQPMTQYGQYILLSDPTPSKLMVREAKKVLCESIRQTQIKLGLKAKNIRFIVTENYVGWKAEMGAS